MVNKMAEVLRELDEVSAGVVDLTNSAVNSD
jgi:hypothetical protein